MARFQLIRMSSYAKNKLQMCSVTQHQCRCRQMCGKYSQFNQYTHFLSVTKNDLSWLNNLFMARFQLIRMSSYAKNKLQMCSVTQHQCRSCQMCGKCSQITLTVWKMFLWNSPNRFLLHSHKNECSTQKFPHICLHWCWVTEHICGLFTNISGHSIELKPCHE